MLVDYASSARYVGLSLDRYVGFAFTCNLFSICMGKQTQSLRINYIMIQYDVLYRFVKDLMIEFIVK